MATDVIMPQMGFDMQEGKILQWLKTEGEQVLRGEAIAEIETDKATVQVEAFDSGVLGRIFSLEGETVPVGQVIAVIAAPGEAVPESPSDTSSEAGNPTTEAAQSQPATPLEAEILEGIPRHEGRIAITPVARRIAQQAGVPTEEIERNVAGTGAGHRITREDVESYLAQRQTAPSAGTPTAGISVNAARKSEAAPSIGIVVPQGLSPMRQAIARRMAQSMLTAPHFYVTVYADVTQAMALRAELNSGLSDDERISVNDMIIKAATLALVKHPHYNVAVLPEGIVPHPDISIGIVVALDEGLIAPGLQDTGSKALREIAIATKDLIARTRQGRLRPEEYGGGGFSVSNMGMYNVDSFTAIITPPNAGAVAIGSVTPTPVVRGGDITVAHVMSLTLSTDHRAADGAQAARFLTEIQGFLEKPLPLFLQ